MSRVIVVGAGLAGLSAACHLVGDGHDVTVLERNPGPGGRNDVLRSNGFTFDSGPTVLTMPELVDRALARVGASVATHLPLRRLDPAYRAVYADGSQLHVRAGVQQMRDEIAATVSAADADAFSEFVRWLGKLYDVEMRHFIDRNFDSVLDLLSRPGPAAKLVSLGGFSRLGRAVSRRFADDRLVRLFTFQAMYAGVAPADALAIYAVITYMDSIAGVWFPDEGMHAVPRALADAAAAAGAKFHYDTGVDRVLTDASGRVAGAEAAGQFLGADAVVLTVDLPAAYRTLLPGLRPPRAIRNGVYSPSAVVWHVGVRGTPSGVAHHNIHFGRAWDESFTQLIGQGRLMSDPSRLVTVPTLDAPQLAPDGHSVLYVLEPVPNTTAEIDWSREREPMRERLAGFLAESGYPTDIVTEHLVTPADWAAQGLAAGTPFSLAHTFFQSGPFRPPNVERRVPGLFFAGTGTTPGVGVPMVLISGELVSRRVDEHVRRRS
ncbi:MAG: phytoene desaturase family protein [Candidatus Nanopelagicales bacterium]